MRYVLSPRRLRLRHADLLSARQFITQPSRNIGSDAADAISVIYILGAAQPQFITIEARSLKHFEF